MKRMMLITAVIAVLITGCGLSDSSTDTAAHGGENTAAPESGQTGSDTSSAAPEEGQTESEGNMALNQENTEITYLSFSYSGTIMGLGRSFELKSEDGRFIFSYRDIKLSRDGVMSMELDPAVIKEAEAICKKYDVRSWDGLDRSAQNLYDGEGFSLNLEFADGTSVSAKGYGIFPDDYFDFKNDFLELLKPYIDELEAEFSGPKA